MPLDRTHQHISTDIMQVGAVHTPIGVTQTVSLLGPFPLDWDSVGVDGTGGDPSPYWDGGYVTVGDTPAGSRVLAAWPEISIGFFGSNFDVDINLNIQPTDNPDDAALLSVWQGNGDLQSSSDYVVARVSGSALDVGRTAIGHAITACQVMASAGAPEAPTQGAADIYVLIATPTT